MPNLQIKGVISRKEEIKKIDRVVEMERRYAMLIPMEPEYDPTMCRDEFLRKLFAELDLPEYEKLGADTSSDSSQSGFTLPTGFAETTTLSSFIKHEPTIIKTARVLERAQSNDMSVGPAKISVMTGQTDLYGALLESVKRSSLYFMFSRVINRLRIMQKISLDWGTIELNSLPHMLFGWSMDEFFKRCMLPDSIYLDVLQLKHSDESLDWAKFSSDVKEIIRYFKFFYSETFLEKGYKNMLTIIWDQQQLLKIGAQLERNLKISQKDLNKIVQNTSKISSAWWGQYRRNLVKDCRLRAMRATVILPIERRYIRGYYATLMEMQMLKDNMPVEQLRKRIEEVKQQMVNEQHSTNQAMIVYSLISENCQNRIADFSKKLSTESSYWEDENILLTFRLTKAVDDYKEATEKLELMHRRIKEVQELIRAERQTHFDSIVNAQLPITRKRKSTVKPKKPAKKYRANRKNTAKA